MKLVELHRVFTIKHGSKLDLNKMDECPPEVPDAVLFVGRSGERNGFTAFVRSLPNVTPFEGGLITVALGGSALSSFVQSRPFYTAQNIDVLSPKVEMSLDLKLYYCLCIEANRFRYSTFGREANRTLKNLLVPALESVPSWVEGMTTRATQDLCRDLTALAQRAVQQG